LRAGFLTHVKRPGIVAALSSALLFGAGTPVAKLLLNGVSTWLLAALLYLGSGLGLFIYRRISRASGVKLRLNEWLWFAGAILAGGVVAPVLQMFGLTGMPASGASLLLNLEGVITALLAWFVFRENFDFRIALGMAAIVTGAVVLSWPSGQAVELGSLWPGLAIVGACLGWGIDNNLTRKVALADATWLASMKGLTAGLVNLVLAVLLGTSWPSLPNLAGALITGFLAYGVSLALFVVGLRHLGTARAGAYYSIAPFFGAALSIVALGEMPTLALFLAGGFMAVGLWLHLTEKHKHRHTHRVLVHTHAHVHDEHHSHPHSPGKAPPSTANHSHAHRHEALPHSHDHFPDMHHQHGH
jgi:drug/metabolite transporter (DMT)-like permease